MSDTSTAIVWFRRDLRLHDHPALAHAIATHDRVVSLFVVDERLLAGGWRSPNRLWFLAGAVESLAAGIRERDATLLVERGDPVELVPRLAAELGATTVVASRDYAPYGRRRDAAVAAALASAGVAWAAGRGQLIQEPEALARDGGGPFTVFSPFHRRWQGLPVRAAVTVPDRIVGPSRVRSGTAPGVRQLLGDPVPTADPGLLPAPGEPAARARLEAWAGSAALHAYDEGRDRLDIDGTSRLSQDLRFGLVSPVEVLDRTRGDGPGPQRFHSELAWRDFYAHLLWHEPRVARESFQRRLDGIAWSTDAGTIQAWKQGRTGYPVVDAAMRQLLATGWMPNRARMISASFLTKHLGVDWRVGEAHFMEHLVDGDPASNNGGWQWAASTGTDAQPWFRVFNPTLQGRRHDPDGTYVRRWVPELAGAGLSGSDVHQPPSGAYLAPIVGHAEARARALAVFRSATARG